MGDIISKASWCGLTVTNDKVDVKDVSQHKEWYLKTHIKKFQKLKKHSADDTNWPDARDLASHSIGN